jgi:hypothetical protein
MLEYINIIQSTGGDDLALDITPGLGTMAAQKAAETAALVQAGTSQLAADAAGVVAKGSGLGASEARKLLVELQAERAQGAQLAKSIAERDTELAGLRAKLLGAQERLTDALSRDESMNNKFGALARGIDDLRLQLILKEKLRDDDEESDSESGGTGPESNNNNREKEGTGGTGMLNQLNQTQTSSGSASKKAQAKDQATIWALRQSVVALEDELALANRRASDSERRLLDTRKSYDEALAEFETTRTRLGKIMEDRADKYGTLLDSHRELEVVSASLYQELQVSTCPHVLCYMLFIPIPYLLFLWLLPAPLLTFSSLFSLSIQ